jgi:hypothetical protein
VFPSASELLFDFAQLTKTFGDQEQFDTPEAGTLNPLYH